MSNLIDPGLQREVDDLVNREIADIERRIRAEGLASHVALDIDEAAPVAAVQACEPQPLVTAVNRRSFLQGGTAAVAAASVAGTLQMFMARRAEATNAGYRPTVAVPSPYGAPVATNDQVTGLPLLGLPPGFKYWSHGWTGDPLFPNLDGSPITPSLHDGMGVLLEVGPLVVLCRNHEAGAGPSYFGGRLQYSAGAAGGNTNLVFDKRQRKWLLSWPTLSGTYRNCAGGTTPQRTWLSCEETTTTTPSGADTLSHGWIFEVPALGVSNAKPIKAMGRRSHEGAAVDPRTGFVYITEDAAPGGVYRFKPDRRYNYLAGGELEMLKVVGRPNVNLRGANPLGGGGAPYPVPVGTPLDVEWVPIADPESISPSNYAQGAALGGADFRRPEGIWYGDGTMFFVSTDGGATANGQVFALDVKKQQLTLIYDVPTQDELENPDNLTVTPRGGLLFCEDNSGSPQFLLDGVSTERLVGLTKKGEIFTFATNLINFATPYTRPGNALVFTGNQRANEWAGATFDSDGDWLFVNIQTPGITFAITGPWKNGPL